MEIESYELEPLERDVSSDFTRLSTVIHMAGGGEDGVGEDVTYDALDHVALQEAGPVHDLSGRRTLAELFERIGGLDLFPAGAGARVSRLYRRWAFESAALDLALRQAGRSLAEALGREPRPVDVRRLAAARRAGVAGAAAAAGWRTTRRCASSSTRRATGPTS